ncbi:Sugar (and other) transporter-like protein 62 [Elsinoe fawcettii]|nr:Sugar (and other) transporter-like protein 62 [Elsinoe fawcettii]
MTDLDNTTRRRMTAADRHLELPNGYIDPTSPPRTSHHSHARSPSRVSPAPKPTTSRIYLDNPLTHLDPGELENAARTFAEVAGLKSITGLLIKGAKFAQNQEKWRSLPGLTDEEREVLETHAKGTSFLDQPKELQVTLLACACAALVQGWDQASLNGANLRWPEDLGLAEGLDIGRPYEVWLFALTNSIVYLGAGCFCYLSDTLNEYLLGRRAAIFVAALCSMSAVIGSACVRNVWELLACRIILAAGIGTKASVTSIFMAEVAPARLRGSLVMNWQVFVAFGIFLGHSANLAVFDIRSLNWRLQLFAACIPCIPLALLIFCCPESPRFLIKKQRWKKAYRSLCYLNKLPLIAAKELFLIHTQMQAEARMYTSSGPEPEPSDDPDDDRVDAASLTDNKDIYVTQGGTSFFRRFRQLFSVPRIRRASTAAFVIMITQQLCGINVMSFYSATIVSGGVKYSDPPEVKYTEWRKALWISWGIGITNFVFAFPAYGTIDRWGRRALVLLMLPFLALFLVAAAFCFRIPEGSGQLAGVGTFLVLFTISYSFSCGVVPFSYSAEVFPIVNREVGMSFAVFSNLFGAGILSLFVPFLNTELTATGLLCLFAGLNILAFVLVWLFMYETKQAVLEEMNALFNVPTRAHVMYQWRVMVPWIWNTFIRRRDTGTPDPLPVWYDAQRIGAGSETADIRALDLVEPEPDNYARVANPQAGPSGLVPRPIAGPLNMTVSRILMHCVDAVLTGTRVHALELVTQCERLAGDPVSAEGIQSNVNLTLLTHATADNTLSNAQLEAAIGEFQG